MALAMLPRFAPPDAQLRATLIRASIMATEMFWRTVIICCFCKYIYNVAGLSRGPCDLQPYGEILTSGPPDHMLGFSLLLFFFIVSFPYLARTIRLAQDALHRRTGLSRTRSVRNS